MVPFLLSAVLLAFAQDAPPASAPAKGARTYPKDAAKAQANVKRVIDKFSTNKPMSYEMESTNQVMGATIKSKGSVLIGSDGKARMEMTQDNPMTGPGKNTIVMDGKSVWIYTNNPMGNFVVTGTKEEMEQMGKRYGASGGGRNQADLGSQLKTLQESFTLDGFEDGITIDGKPGFAIFGELKKTPPAAGGEQSPAEMARMMGTQTLRLAFLKDGDLLTTVEMFDGSGKALNSTAFRNHNLDPKLPDGAFTFTPPEGVKVMTFRELMKGMQGGGGGDEGDEEETPPAKPASKPAGGGH